MRIGTWTRGFQHQRLKGLKRKNPTSAISKSIVLNNYISFICMYTQLDQKRNDLMQQILDAEHKEDQDKRTYSKEAGSV